MKIRNVTVLLALFLGLFVLAVPLMLQSADKLQTTTATSDVHLPEGNNVQEVRDLWPDGSLKSVYFAIRDESNPGVRHGHWFSYFENGKTEREGSYEHGKQVGVWTYYSWPTGAIAWKGDIEEITSRKPKEPPSSEVIELSTPTTAHDEKPSIVSSPQQLLCTGSVGGSWFVSLGSGDTAVLRGQIVYLINDASTSGLTWAFEGEKVFVDARMTELANAKGVNRDPFLYKMNRSLGMAEDAESIYRKVETVIAKIATQSPTQKSTTDASGRFAFSSVPCGKYTIYAVHRSSGDVAIWRVETVVDNREQEVVLSTDNVRTVFGDEKVLE